VNKKPKQREHKPNNREQQAKARWTTSQTTWTIKVNEKIPRKFKPGKHKQGGIYFINQEKEGREKQEELPKGLEI